MEDHHVSEGLITAHVTHNFHPPLFSPALSHLNLIRSVTTILEIMDKATKDQYDRLQRQQRSLSPSRPHRTGNTFLSSGDHECSDDETQDLIFNFSDKHKLLQLRLQPLARIQKDLEKYLGSAALEPDRVATTSNIAFPIPGTESPVPSRRHTEFSVSVNSSWKARLLGKEEDSEQLTKRKSTQGVHDATEIIYRCGPDIKQLWTDDVVQQVLKGTKTQLEHSSGL